ncbi:MAG: hypothetical protein M0003_02640 [Acidithiobacillus sp.]|nr:hypothetical protein [Acidithiobacillus sp.]
MSDLDDLEALANTGARGATSSMDEEEDHAPDVVTPPAVPAPRMRIGDGSSARDIALQGLSPSLREHVIADAAEMGIRLESDLSWLLVGAQIRAWASATASGDAARLVHEDVGKIPDLIHHAVLVGGNDLTGQIKTAMTANVRELALAIQGGIAKATQPSVTAVQTALQDFDSKVDKTIIARRDAVLAQWVQSGSDALDDRVREAIKTERTANLVFMSFGFFGVFVLGILLGMHVHF